MNFAPTGYGLQIFKERYAFDEKETWPMACRRVAECIGREEIYPSVWSENFYNEIVNGNFMPGGRILYGSGRKTQQMLNCFTVGTEDSINGWAKTLGDLMKISSVGGGVGCNLSPIRPRGSSISRGGEATGAVSLMEIMNAAGNVIKGGGGRRTAMMLLLDVEHGDANEFINKKLDSTALNNANISVMLGKNASYDVLDSNKFENAAFNAWKSGEPGILNQRLANEMSNIFYSHDLNATNPCAEQWLPDYGCCCLGALVLPRFIENGKIMWDKLKRSIRTAVRFLDNVLDCNAYPIPETENMSMSERRIGLGVMGLHSALLALGKTYLDLNIIESIMSFVRKNAYAASADLAAEKGSFPLYDPEMHQSGFYKLHPDLPHIPMRNCAVLTVAPSGTTSMIHQVSSGIEPLFAARYIRRRYQGDNLQRTLVVTKEFTDYGDKVHGAYDLSPEQHLNAQVVIQKHIDSAVSKTCNIPEDYPQERLYGLLKKFAPHLKGFTLYRSGSRGNEPLEFIPNGSVIDSSRYDEIAYEGDEEIVDTCEDGVCQL